VPGVSGILSLVAYLWLSQQAVEPQDASHRVIKGTSPVGATEMFMGLGMRVAPRLL